MIDSFKEKMLSVIKDDESSEYESNGEKTASKDWSFWVEFDDTK